MGWTEVVYWLQINTYFLSPLYMRVILLSTAIISSAALTGYLIAALGIAYFSFPL
jgi:hypothetical protein